VNDPLSAYDPIGLAIRTTITIGDIVETDDSSRYVSEYRRVMRRRPSLVSQEFGATLSIPDAGVDASWSASDPCACKFTIRSVGYSLHRVVFTGASSLLVPHEMVHWDSHQPILDKYAGILTETRSCSYTSWILGLWPIREVQTVEGCSARGVTLQAHLMRALQRSSRRMGGKTHGVMGSNALTHTAADIAAARAALPRLAGDLAVSDWTCADTR
jgi:hypothetical protein